MAVNWKTAQAKAARTARWAVTMTKVRIRRVTARTRWQLITFHGQAGGESRGIVDLVAIRKDQRKSKAGLGRGDQLEIILIQVKGGASAMPTVDDWRRLLAVARRHRATGSLLSVWKAGKDAKFFKPKLKTVNGRLRWTKVDDLHAVFH